MKVLLPIIYHDLTHCIERAFVDAGHEVRVVDWRKARKKGNRKTVEQMCVEEALRFKPDLAFCQFQSPDIISKKFPKALKQIGCFSVNWAGDVRNPLPMWYKSLAPYFSVTSFTNWPDVEEIQNLGHRAEFLQVGYEERLYNTEGAGERSGVVFIGNNYSGKKLPESGGRRDMVKALSAAFPEDFKVYGMSWDGVAPPDNIGGYVREPGDADILRGASIAVGWDHFHRPGFASDRLLRATACGCATINQYYEGIEGEHPRVVSVTSVDEMVEAVRLLLSKPEAALELGRLNAENTLDQHRWNERVKVIENWMHEPV